MSLRSKTIGARALVLATSLHLAACAHSQTTPTLHPPTALIEYVPAIRFDRDAVQLEHSDATGRYFLWGPLRVQIQQSAVRFAAPFTETDLLAAVRIEHGWLFVDRSGQIAVADSFVGEPRVIGSIPAGWSVPTSATASNGRFVLSRNRGDVISTDGTGPMTAMRGVPASGVRWVVFTDARRGVLAGWDGRLSVTHDGGETFGAIDLGTDVLVGDRVVTSDGTLGFRTTAGLRSVLADDRVTPWTPSNDSTGAGITPGEYDAMLTALMTRMPRVMTRLPRLSSGERWLLLADSLRRFDADGRLIGSHPVSRDLGGCELESWGTSMVARCAGSDGDRLLSIGPDGALGSELPIDWDALSDDGLHAAFSGPCAGPDRRAHAVCVRSADGRTHDVALPDSVRVVDPHGGMLIARSLDNDDRDGAGSAVFQIDSEHGVGTAIALEAPTGVNALRVYSAHYTPSGDVLVIARPRAEAASAATYVAVGPIAGPLRLHALPPGARWADFVTALHGFAAGHTSEELFETRDAGDHWSPVRVHGSGGTPFVLGDTMVGMQRTATMHCDATGCLVGRALWVPAEGVPTTSVLSVAPHGDSVPPATEADRDDDWGPIDAPVDIHCSESPMHAAGGRARHDVGGDGSSHGATGAVRWSVQIVGAGASATVRLKWEGVDYHGAFRSTSNGPILDAGTNADAFHVIGGDREHALLETCSNSPRRCSLRIATSRAAIRLALGVDAWGALRGSAPSSAIVRSLHDGIAVEFSTQMEGVAVATALQLAEDGHVVARRTAPLEALGDQTLHGLGVRGESVGLVVVARDHANTMAFQPLNAPATTAPLAHTPVVAACSTPDAAWTLVTRVRMPSVVSGHTALTASVGSILIRDDGAACLSDVIALGPPSAHRDWTLLAVSAGPDGVRAMEPGEATPLTCTEARE